MKRLVLTIAMLMLFFTTVGQENSSSGNQENNQGSASSVSQENGSFVGLKGSFLTIAGGIGGGGFQYKLKEYTLTGAGSDGINKDKLGWNAKIGYSYYFDYHWGLHTGVGMAYYRTIGEYKEDFSNNVFRFLGNQIDDDDPPNIKDYQLRVRLQNWQEEQKGYFIEVPLMLMFKHKFGETKKHGFYIGLGAKLQIPIIKTVYTVLDGEKSTDKRLNVSGRYIDDPTLELGAIGAPDLSQHGFGSIHNPWNTLGWEGDLNLKMSIAGTAEIGFLIWLGKRVDLMLGGFFDYGFNNIKKGNDAPLLEPPVQYHPGANPDDKKENVGAGIPYNGMINSDRTEKVNLMAYGGRVGLHIKLGKLTEDKKEPTPLPVFPEYDDDDADLDSLERLLMEMRALLQALLEEPEPEEEPMIVVQGSILDSKTREPLSAIIEITNVRTGKLAAITRTDSITGQYKFTDIEPGNYMVDIRKEGYLYYTDQFMIPISDERQVVDKLALLDKITKNTVIILKIIFFDTGKSTLKPESMSEIDRVYQLMIDNPTMEIEISGHTDNQGSAALNKNLSAARANVVVQTLIKKGIEPSRMTSAGYGFDKPVAPNTTADGRAQNRRTEFKVTEM